MAGYTSLSDTAVLSTVSEREQRSTSELLIPTTGLGRSRPGMKSNTQIHGVVFSCHSASGRFFLNGYFPMSAHVNAWSRPLVYWGDIDFMPGHTDGAISLTMNQCQEM